MIILEINEFNPDLLKQYAESLRLDAISEILSYSHSRITTDDKEERYGLDPWVQWVNIHTGLKREQHGINHLGDIIGLSPDILQIWEHLHSTIGTRFNIWGCMNSSSRLPVENSSFFPDPWTFDVNATPERVNELLSLPRFYAKNYLHLKQWQGLKAVIQTTKYLLRPKNLSASIKTFGMMMAAILSGKLNSNVLFTAFDKLLGELFLKHIEEGQLNILFMNSVAHLQHNYWTKSEHNNDIALCLRSLNTTIGKILKKHPNEPIIVLNAFQQIRTFDKGEFLYRQKDTETLLRALNIKYQKVNQLMTNDAHVFFTRSEELEAAYQILSNSTVNGDQAFQVEKDENKLCIFFQFTIWKEIKDDSKIKTPHQMLEFYQHYSRVVQRTGSHINIGDAYSKDVNLPSRLGNHEVFSHIESHFQRQT